MIHLKKLILLSAAMVCVLSCKMAERIDLSGKWEIALDSLDVGVAEKWFERDFTNTMDLPATLCDAGYGTSCTLQPVMQREVFLNLKRKYDYVGVAWFKKTIEIPVSWKDKVVFLNLERVIWNSQVWIDGRKVAQENESLITPHRFDLSDYLSPGKHTVHIRLDNRKKYDISYRDMGHAYTNETQTMWNGILGNICLESRNKVFIDDMQIYPDTDKKKINVKIKVAGFTPGTTGKLSFYVREQDGKTLSVKAIDVSDPGISFDYPIENPKLWDEFEPNLYDAVANISANSGIDTRTVSFGMRKLTNDNALLQINGRRIFLRGTLECCIFPLKGYPPTDHMGKSVSFGPVIRVEPFAFPFVVSPQSGF